jgi:two-component system LytT family sensor kinase
VQALLICSKFIRVKYSSWELSAFSGFGIFVFWFIFQMWGMPCALAALGAAFLLPRFLLKRNYFIFGLLTVLLVLSFGTLLFNSNVNFPVFRNFPNGKLNDFFLKMFSAYMLVFVSCVIGAILRFVFLRLHTEKEMQKLQNDSLMAEIGFLKAQINPHFLFNMLNTIYYQVDRHNEQARDTISKFSELLRYQLYHSEEITIDIHKELEFVKNFIELQKLRMNSSYTVSLQEPGNINGFAIAPLLLIPMVENCFKHVSHFSEKTNHIEFAIICSDNNFTFKAYNTIEKQDILIDENRDSGIGLKNLKRRLDLIYPGKHQLITKKEENYFEIILTIETQ